MTLPVSTPTTERSSSAMKTFKSMLKNMMEDEFIPDSMIIYIEREIAKSFSPDSFIDDLESLNECNDSQLCSSVNGGIERPSELLDEEETDGPVPLQVADDMVEDDISFRAADFSVPNLGLEASSDVTAHLSSVSK
ncbi:uncharacterized protein [Medicago truncatula]|uniref:uncharacterized protein n=1 Tax=Medicago truncatula TaxID=3880 RepID=UPI001967347D|nr:uncharacterized protein LOC112417449 [Medicago truncatula]XP_039684587.1 uncharacterized protein LOC112417449 [Medicago truncatula]